MQYVPSQYRNETLSPCCFKTPPQSSPSPRGSASSTNSVLPISAMFTTDPNLSQARVFFVAQASMPFVKTLLKKPGRIFFKTCTKPATKRTSGRTRTKKLKKLCNTDFRFVNTKGIKPTTCVICEGCCFIARSAISTPMLCPTTTEFCRVSPPPRTNDFRRHVFHLFPERKPLGVLRTHVLFGVPDVPDDLHRGGAVQLAPKRLREPLVKSRHAGISRDHKHLVDGAAVPWCTTHGGFDAYPFEGNPRRGRGDTRGNLSQRYRDARGCLAQTSGLRWGQGMSTADIDFLPRQTRRATRDEVGRDARGGEAAC